MHSPIRLAAAAAILFACAQAALAQSFPARPIRLIVPYGPGASTDTMGRMVAQKVSEDLRQPVIVENRAGASGMIGADMAMKAPPDGYTILLGTDATHSGNAHLMKAPPFHPVKDSTPITMAAKNILVLAASPAFPPSNIAELLDYSKKNPGKLSYGSSGSGSPHHLAGVLLNQMAGSDLVHVAYKGGAPAITDVLGGQLPLVFSSMVAVTAQIKAGKLKALAVTSAKRVPAFPNIPTLDELGIKGYQATTWYGMWAVKGSPPEVVNRTYQDVAKIMQEPAIKDFWFNQGAEPGGNSPAEFSKFIGAEIEKWGKVVKASGAKIDL